MRLEELVESARQLPRVPSAAAEEFSGSRQALVEFVNREMGARADLHSLVGPQGELLMQDNHRNHTRFMSNVLLLNQFEMLARTLPWVYKTYIQHRFSGDYFPIALECWKDAVREYLPAEHAKHVIRVYDWMIAHHEDVMGILDGSAHGSPPEMPGENAGRLLHYLLDGLEPEALEFAHGMVHGPEDLEPFYRDVIQPCMYEVGNLWERDEITSAEEHMITAIAGRLMSSFYPHLIGKSPARGRVLVTSVTNEYHELGARMVADILTVGGWETAYVGANTPLNDLLGMMEKKHYDVLALSITMSFNVDRARRIIAMIRNMPKYDSLRIIVGGRVISQLPSLAHDIGADGWAPDPGSIRELLDEWWEKNHA